MTRMKEKAVYEVQEELQVPQNSKVVRGIRSSISRDLARGARNRCYSGG